MFKYPAMMQSARGLTPALNLQTKIASLEQFLAKNEARLEAMSSAGRQIERELRLSFVGPDKRKLLPRLLNWAPE